MHLSLNGNLSANSSLESFSPDLWPPISEVQWRNHSMKYVLTVSPRVHDLISPWMNCNLQVVADRKYRHNWKAVDRCVRALKSIYRDLIRLHAICFGVLYLLWANYGAQCQLNKGIIFVFVSGFSRDKYSTRSVSVHHIGFIGQDLRSDSHFSKSSQSHFLLSGALLFIGHHSRSLEMNGILEVLNGQYLISFQLYFLHYPRFGWCNLNGH